MNLKQFVAAVMIVSFVSAAAQASFFPGQIYPLGPMELTHSVTQNTEGNTVWTFAILSDRNSSVALELGFEVIDPRGDAFVDHPNPVQGGTVDSSDTALFLDAVGWYDAADDTHWIEFSDDPRRHGPDTENLGNNTFTGGQTSFWQGRDGVQQDDNPNQFFVALGGGGENWEDLGNGTFRMPVMQLVTAGTEVEVTGLVAQDFGEQGDKFEIIQEYGRFNPETGEGGLVINDVPEPTTCMLASLTLVGIVGLRRRD